jgi:hypothetical protein
MTRLRAGLAVAADGQMAALFRARSVAERCAAPERKRRPPRAEHSAQTVPVGAPVASLIPATLVPVFLLAISRPVQC